MAVECSRGSNHLSGIRPWRTDSGSTPLQDAPAHNLSVLKVSRFSWLRGEAGGGSEGKGEGDVGEGEEEQ